MRPQKPPSWPAARSDRWGFIARPYGAQPDGGFLQSKAAPQNGYFAPGLRFKTLSLVLAAIAMT